MANGIAEARQRTGISSVRRILAWPSARSSFLRIHAQAWSFQPGSRTLPAPLRDLVGAAEDRVSAPEYLRNVIRIITETGLRVYKELTPMKKEQLDLENAVVWIPDSKTANGVAEVPLTECAVGRFSAPNGDFGARPVSVPER